MEEFLKIDWHPPLEDMITKVFVNEERLKNESVMYKMMYGLFTDPLTEFESNDSEEEEEEEDEEEKEEKEEEEKATAKQNKMPVQKASGYIPGIVKSPFQFPRCSNLNKEQHATCLRVFLRFSAREKPEIDPKSRSELELYMNLCPTIKAEQDEFLDLAKANWNGSSLKLIGKEYINERWKSKVEKLRELPRYYVAAGNVPFNGEDKISVTAEETLLEMGQIPRAIIPACNNKRFLLYYSLDKLQLLYPARNDPSLQKWTVSEDPNCERLADSGEVDLVISSGGLNCLANNFPPNYTTAWILPVVVKKSARGNTIYVDKPLPPTAMTVPQKNAWIYKYIIKSQLLHPNHPTSIRLSDQEKREVIDYDLFGEPNSEEFLKLEEEHDRLQSYDGKRKVFIGDDPVTSETMHEVDSSENDLHISQKLSSSPFNTDESNQRKENKKVLIEFVKSQETVSFSNMETNTNEGEVISDEEMLETQTMETETHDSQGSTESSVPLACPPGRNNVVYNIFSLGPSADTKNDSLKTKVEDYRILVRTKTDGIERIDKETLEPVMLVPKLEHQVALGAEAVTAEEALKQWTMLTYRPNTCLVRIRISAENSEVIQVERRTAISINNEIKRLYSLNAENSLVTLHNVVHSLKALKPGNYLLRHTPTNGAFATIYQEATDTSGKNVFDLQALYAQKSLQTMSNPPWPALDKVVVTPSQACFERMPAMYHPPRNDLDIRSKVTRGRGRGGFRGRGRGVSRGAGRGGLQNSGRGGPRGGLQGGTRVRTKKAKKKNKGAKTEVENS